MERAVSATCKYCEREHCDTDCYAADREEDAPPRRTAKEWREQGAAAQSAVLEHARSRARDLGLCAVELGLMEPCPRSGGCDQPTCMCCYPEPGDEPPSPFTDIIRPAACGGVTITIDHPAGPLTWQLPRPRAVEFLAAFSAAMEGR
jgi:hypothetical protein